MPVQDNHGYGFGLYLHWPYCVSKCPYCDFNSHVAQSIDHSTWAQAYATEITRLATELPGRTLQTIYFGGGTPSLMEPATVARVIEVARASWPAGNDMEITLEANPGSVEATKFRDYAQAGVNRVSLGLQALDDNALRQLGRAHTMAEGLRAFDIARTEFSRVSFDLIYARQGQSREAWRAELANALKMQPEHLSLYQLTIEDGTVFARRFAAGQLRGLPGEDLSADMYLDTRLACAEAGLVDYEVSNYAVPGQESRHNLIYWHGGDYLGIGPGAHGRITMGDNRYATTCPKGPNQWLAKVNSAGSGEDPREYLTPQDRAEEYLLMGLRLNEGIDPERFSELSGHPLPPGKITELCDLGLLSRTDGRLAATLQGRLVLNSLLAELVA